MEAIVKFLAGFVVVVGFMFLFALLLAYPIMWTWNYTFPGLFGWPTIDVWQALWGSVWIRLVFPSASGTSSK